MAMSLVAGSQDDHQYWCNLKSVVVYLSKQFNFSALIHGFNSGKEYDMFPRSSISQKVPPWIDKNVMVAREYIQTIHSTNQQCNSSWNFIEPIISAAEETILQQQIDPFYGASNAII